MSTDEILDDLITAQENLTDLEDQAARAASERDLLLVRARKTGTSAQRLAELTGLNRSRIYQILKREGLTP